VERALCSLSAADTRSASGFMSSDSRCSRYAVLRPCHEPYDHSSSSVQARTRAATSGPKRVAISWSHTSWSSMASCRSAAIAWSSDPPYSSTIAATDNR
jgi:hypothetical protein